MIFHNLILLIVLLTRIHALKPIHLAVVICGDRVDEGLNALKSALIFTPPPIMFHVFIEDNLREDFKHKVNSNWPIDYKLKCEIEFYPIEFPRGNEHQWRTLFKQCCTQRLFIPEILKNLDSIIYIDTDVLFLSNVRHLWRFFRKFNSTQLAASAPEHEDPSMGWYNRFARHPYYGSLGLNSGVMLMNLTRMRQVNMISKIMTIFDEYRFNITWGDQCLLNIYFNYHPDQMFELTCDWNYRPDHCIYENNCQKAKDDGIKIVHGCRRAFHSDKFPEFQTIYQVIQNWTFDKNIKNTLQKNINDNLKPNALSNCGKSKDLFIKHLSKEISALNQSLKTAYHIAFIYNNKWNFIEQAYIFLKSLHLFSSKQSSFIHLHFIIDDEIARNYFSKQIEPLGHPTTYYNSTVNHPFQLSTILNIDRVVYIYPDIIFINKFDKLWSLFDQFTSEDAIGMFAHCQLSGTSNVLLFDLNRMKSLNHNSNDNQQLTTKNIKFLPCRLISHSDQCQSIDGILYLSNTVDHSIFEYLYKKINQIDLNDRNVWNETFENELNHIEDIQCRDEFKKLILKNKNN